MSSELERLVRIGAALRGEGEALAALGAAWEEVRAVAAGREVGLEVRIEGRLQRFGTRRRGPGYEAFGLGARGASGGALFVARAVGGREREIAGGERQALEVAAMLLGLFVENRELAAGVAARREVDGLTGCMTRRAGMERIGRELRRARARRCGASLIFLDVDRLKRLNDRYGHGFGDAVLAAVGTVLGGGLQGADVRCRYGGDEFVVLLPERAREGAVRVAEKLRGALAERPVAAADGLVVPAASFGVSATVRGECGAEALVARADAAMYMAKRDGGNAVRVWEPDSDWRDRCGAAARSAFAHSQESAP